MKMKETSYQLENGYHNQPALGTASSNTYSQMQHSLTYLQDLIPTLTGTKIISKHTSQNRD